jgi:hypothetical protein
MTEHEKHLFETAIKTLYVVANKDRHEGQFDDLRWLSKVLWRYWSLHRSGHLETEKMDGVAAARVATSELPSFTPSPVRYPWQDDLD